MDDFDTLYNIYFLNVFISITSKPSKIETEIFKKHYFRYLCRLVLELMRYIAKHFRTIKRNLL